jgi:hypothetical protein
MPNHYPNLNPEKALIWRITHRKNLPWILANGLHAGNSGPRLRDWVSIGNEDLIGRRAHRKVPVPPGGVLNDYVPFYFTPFSPMRISPPSIGRCCKRAISSVTRTTRRRWNATRRRR